MLTWLILGYFAASKLKSRVSPGSLSLRLKKQKKDEDLMSSSFLDFDDAL